MTVKADRNNVFVAGASGATGRRVVQELRKKGFKVRAGVRDAEKARSSGLQVDNKVELGNCNLVDAAKQKGISKFVLMSSLLTNGAASEKYLRSSGLEWTVVRPGGLSNKPLAEVGNLIVGKEDTLFGRPSDPGKDISRDLVAAVLVEAVTQPGASNKVVEIVSSKDASELPPDQWFSNI
ncbi:NAD(P)-binding protein [Coccomyxa subellipsoidea C-169]|uniref:NAD(P)-binding protein n=1 Tax=Coccomyxa subellipsoidea (strain C-169) TaxID=574566 RepID=I0Z986_COCSC|nr:NAD(P)-binding protein [Coccomyxa subellipsoidea C-169]EIE27205.1 NAD(P)-binding protein [Coccomyxa subellipsoidea C-169]|eukprot:XP_005651749.1 NAD(P)-binding protein [Coccomyxa subellipsoidea C-169]